MKLSLPFQCQLLAVVLLVLAQKADAQFLMDMTDTTMQAPEGLVTIYKRYDHARISGYIQPQFQVAQSKGVESFNGGDFGPAMNNRFMLRRGRLRFDYARFTQNNKPSLQFVFQFDGTEKGVFIRDFWGRFYENKWEVLSFSAGMFARPFGYEVNLGSPDRESPERGRMSQLLMRVERDLGVMVSFEPRKKDHPLHLLKFDVGVFNGQGLTGPGEYDNHKDIIGRIGLKPYELAKNVKLSAGIGLVQGGFIQNSKYVYKMNTSGNQHLFEVDSAVTNIGDIASRQYRGGDVQLKIKHKWGHTELRGEYWWGTQTATASTSETPGLLINEPYYIRKFNGAFFYFLQNIINKQHQLGIKYDWYDPNTDVKGDDIGQPGNNLEKANIKYNTLGVGYNYFINDNLRLLLWYEWITNEKTALAGFTEDAKDNIFTCRLQFRF
jgi:hypothetical protein